MMDTNNTSTMKRVLSFALAVVMVLSMLPGSILPVRAAETCAVTVTKTGNGTVKLGDETVDADTTEQVITVNQAEDVSLVVSPSEGWQIKTVKVNGTELTGVDPDGVSTAVQFAEATGTVEVEFEEKTETPEPTKYQLSLGGGSSSHAKVQYKAISSTDEAFSANGYTTLSDPVPIEAGKILRFYLTAIDKTSGGSKKYYVIQNAKVGTENAELHFVDSGKNAWFDLVMDGDKTVSVETNTQRQLIAETAGNDKAIITLFCSSRDVSDSNEKHRAVLKVGDGDEVSFTVKVKDGKNYIIKSVSASNHTYTVTDGALNTTKLSGKFTISGNNSTITATLAEAFTIQLGEYADGEVKFFGKNDTTGTIIESGKSHTVAKTDLSGAKLVFTPNDGCIVSDLSKIGAGDKLENNRTITGAIERPLDGLSGNSLIVNVTFKQLFTVKVQHEGSGSVSIAVGDEAPAENTEFKVLYGESIVVTATPQNNNYTVSGVTLNGSTDGGMSVNYTQDSDGNDVFLYTFDTTKCEFQNGTNIIKAKFEEKKGYEAVTYSRDPVRPLQKVQSGGKDYAVLVFGPDDDNPLTMEYPGSGERKTVYYDNYIQTGTYYVPFVGNRPIYEYVEDGHSELTASRLVKLLSYDNGEWRWFIDYYWASNWQELTLPKDGLYIVIDKNAPNGQVKSGDIKDNATYFSNLTVHIKARDSIEMSGVPESYSGIAKVYYLVNDDPTPRGVVEIPGYLYETEGFNGNNYPLELTIPTSVGAEANVDGKVKITICVEDHAGNARKINTYNVIFNTTISMPFEEDTPYQTVDSVAYYPADRTAVITVRDTEENINNSTVALKGKINGTEYSNLLTRPEVLLGEDWVLDDETGLYTRTVTFLDGKFELESLSYTVTTTVGEGEDATIQTATDSIDLDDVFFIDTKAPTGEIRADYGTGAYADDTSWSRTLGTEISLDLVTKEDVKLSGVNLVDENSLSASFGSGVDTVKFYTVKKTSIPTSYTDPTETALESATWTDAPTLNADGAYVVYMRVTDMAGNKTYYATGIIVVAKTLLNLELKRTRAHEDSGGHEVKHNDVPVYGIAEEAKVTARLTVPAGNLAGFSTVEYWIVKDGDESSPVHYTVSIAEVTASTYNYEIPIDKTAYDSCDVVVHVKITDKAGNVTEKEMALDIDNTAPAITYEPVWNAAGTRIEKINIHVVERASHFKKDSTKVTIDAVDHNGNAVSNAIYPDGDWKQVGSTDEFVRTYTISKDAIFTVTAKSTDLAGNTTEKEAESFGMDSTPPTGEIWINGAETDPWDEILSFLTFGLWRNETVTVSAEVHDDTSDIKSVSYYVYNYPADETASSEIILSLTELDTLYANGAFTEVTLDANGKATLCELDPECRAVVFLRMEDDPLNGESNYKYISTNGIIVENTPISLTLEPSAPHTTLDGVNLYGANDAPVTVTVTALDPGFRSGIKSVKYWIATTETPAEPATAVEMFNGAPTVNDEHPTYAELVPEFSKAKNGDAAVIPVSIDTYNACTVYVYVKAEDNAGNTRTEHVVLDTDKTAPVIGVKYNDTTKPLAVNNYFTARSAEITITERTHHFDPDAVVINVSGVNGSGAALSGTLYELGAWTTVEGANPDDAKHTVTIYFPADANYTFTVDYTDKAGNKAAQFADSFTVDAKMPDGTVSALSTTWEDIISFLTFGLWSPETIDVTATASDDTSPLQATKYYKTDKTTAMSWEDLDALNEGDWTDFSLEDGLSVPANEKFTVYLRLLDSAGNIRYISTNGLVADNVPCKIELTPSETPHLSNDGVKLYGMDENVSVAVKVTDAEPRSGIKSVTYRILRDGTLTSSGTLYTFEIGNPTYEELKDEFTAVIPVVKEDNNSCHVTVEVTAFDNAGNKSVNQIELDIDNTAPVIGVEYTSTANERAYDNYYTSRSATVTITERTHHFDPKDVVITVKGVDINGQDVTIPAGEQLYSVSGWTTTEGATPDAATHTAVVTFIQDANYTFSVEYTDKAGNEAAEYTDSFTVDKTMPTGTIWIERLKEDPWNDLIATLHFTLFSRDSVLVHETDEDATSPVALVSYFRTSRDTVYKWEDLDALSEDNWKTWTGDSLQIDPDARVVIYLRIIDNAGNVRYISTDGFIVDHTMPAMEDVAPIITVTPPQPVNDIYNADVPVAIHVQDPVIDTSYSGIRQITYEVLNMGTVTQEGTLYLYDGAAATQNELLQVWQQNAAITVDSARNNSNDVVIHVHAIDNSGNESDQTVAIKIDVTAPAISVSYDNNNGDTTFADATTGAYFNANRTATIVITERNFDPSAVIITTTNTDDQLPVLSGWRTEPAGGNGDGTRNIATLSYMVDGDYTFDISCKDLAGNENTAVEYNGLAPQKFTIDKTPPIINVSYEPGDSAAQNGNYFSVPRTATITVTEHNFETSRIAISLTATDNGAPSAAPALSAWTHNGNVHTATISYTADSKYVFDINYRDKAGNAAADYAGDDFYVDQTLPAVELKGVVDESANKDKTIGFVLTATDTNFDVFAPIVTGTYYRDGQFVTEPLTLTDAMFKDIDNGRQLVIDNLPEDGYYTVTCTVVDKAGNAFEEITLYDKDGKAYQAKKTAADSLVTFTVNREGSVYNVDDATADIVNKYYIQNIKNDVVLVEINPDKLTSHVITLNKRELQEGVDYTVTEDADNNWNKYTYTIKRSLFEAEGAYTVVVQSKDIAGNDTFNDVKGVGVKFVVDHTAPIVTVSGLESDGRYQTESQLVTLIPTDDGGALRSLEVSLVDENGNLIEYLIPKLEGEALEKALEEGDGKITFNIGEGLFQNVRIVCDDWADYGDEENVIYDETFTDVSVSTSLIKIFWANKPLRWGTIGGVGGVGAAGLIFFLAKKRKKDDEEEKKAKEAGKAK